MVNLPLGLFLGLLAGAMFSVGTALQKKAAAALPAIESQAGRQNIRNFLSNRTWLIGLVLTTVQWYVALLAMPLLPLSLFSSLLGVNLAILAVFSYFYLEESIGRTEWLGILTIIAGVIVMGITAQKRAERIALTEMIAYFARPRAVWYTGALLAAVAAPIAYSRLRKNSRGDVAFGIAAGSLLALGQIYSKAFMSGFDTGRSLSFTLTTGVWWVFILLLALGNIGNLVTMQFGYQRGKAVVVATLAQVTALIGGMMGGVIIFGEWSGMPSWILVLRIGAVFAILLGIVILSHRSGGGHEGPRALRPMA